jgi:signal transduction histidine kinase
MLQRLPWLGNLRGLRIQLLLWTVLPLTLILIAVAVFGIVTHQNAMQEMIEELDARSARLAAAQLSNELENRVALLGVLAATPELIKEDRLTDVFDGGLAHFTAAGELSVALPSTEIWQNPSVLEWLAVAFPPSSSPASSQKEPLFSPLFTDPDLERTLLLIGLFDLNGGMMVGAVSLEHLELSQMIVQPDMTSEADNPVGQHLGPGKSHPLVFLVDATGMVIYHPDPQQIGRDLQTHEGVVEVTRGRSGATYHREPDGEELVVGYAPVAGPDWGLIVQEPWEAVIAPTMRLSLLAPLVVVVAALISALAVTFGLRYVMHPLQALDKKATRVAWGDFAAVSEPVGGIQEIEDLRRTLEGMAGQIQRYQSSMRDYIATVTMAQEEERKRLARELHDETVQSLIALGHRVEMVQKALAKDPARARQRLDELRTMAADIQDEVRRFSRALRPLYLEDLGFVPALEMLAQETTRQSGLQVLVDLKGEVRRLSPDFELTAYRIMQEGLSNVIHHARAKNVWLTIVFAPDALTLHIHDDGVGFKPPVNPANLSQDGHFGLMGIRERALLFGGRLEIRSKPGQGTSLEVFLPLNIPAQL